MDDKHYKSEKRSVCFILGQEKENTSYSKLAEAYYNSFIGKHSVFTIDTLYKGDFRQKLCNS